MTSRKRTTNQGSSEGELSTAATDANESGSQPQVFSERVGQSNTKPLPDPFGIATDYQAGVRLFESKRDRQMAIMFGEGKPEDKPSQAVIDTLKEAGYRWNPRDKVWTHPVRFESAMTTRIDAQRLYDQVSKMIKEEKGITGEGVPF